MKLKSPVNWMVCAILACTTTGLGIEGAIARPASVLSCSTESYIVLQDGSCVDLSYATVLGQSRRRQAVTTGIYERLKSANQVLDRNRRLTGESDAQAKERQQLEQQYRQVTNQIQQDGQAIEDLIYPVHQRAMGAVYRDWQNRRYTD